MHFLVNTKSNISQNTFKATRAFSKCYNFKLNSLNSDFKYTTNANRNFSSEATDIPESLHENINEILNRLESTLAQTGLLDELNNSTGVSASTDSSDWSGFGIVTSLKDGIVTVSGLPNLGYGDLVTFENWASGLVVSLDLDYAKVVVLGSDRDILVGHTVIPSGIGYSIGVRSGLLGHIIDTFGNILDDRLVNVSDEDEEETYFQSIEVKAPGIIMRQKVNQPVYTGIKIVDSMLPIGKGQRELIIGDRQTGKTTIALDSIINQQQNKANFYDIMYCVYVAIGQKRSSVLNLFEKLIEYDACDYSLIVSATASDSASLQFLAPYAGATIGEFFRNGGNHSLIIYDDLTKHAVAYRQISLLLRRPPGREAYPGDVFYLHSRLLERAAKLHATFGGGSLTALPIIETQAGDVAAYIPTNVISITDGQIFLETGLFYKGIRPAINIGISVSRIGAAAQAKPMRQVSGNLKLELAQFREVEMFMTFGSDIDDITKRILFRGLRLVELLKQPQNKPINIDYQLLLIYAGISGYLDTLPVDKVKIFEERVLSSEIPYLLTVRGQSRWLNNNKKLEFMNAFIEEILSSINLQK